MAQLTGGSEEKKIRSGGVREGKEEGEAKV